MRLDHATLDVTFDLAVEARDFHIQGSVHGIEDGPAGEGDIELVVQHRARTLRVDVNGAEGEIDGTVFLDGEPFATLSGNGENPTILSADGDPLTPGEAFVLQRVVDVSEDVFDFLEDLFDPVDEIVFLGIIL